MTTQNTSAKRDKKKLIFLILVPLLVLFIGYVLFKDQFLKKDSAGGNEQIAAGTPDIKNTFLDSMGKSELYNSLESEEKKAQDGKAVFDELGSISTDMKSQNIEGSSTENLQARLNTEVASPQFNEPDVPSFTPTRRSRGGLSGDYNNGSSFENSSSVDSRKDNESSRDNGFNSVVLADGNKKDNETGGYNQYGDMDYSTVNSDISVLGETTANQKVSNGGTIKIRAKEAFTINGQTIPAGTILTGISRFTESRIDIDIRSVNINNKITYVRLKAFDMDGVEGLQMKETDAAKVGKNVFNEELSSLESSVGNKLSGYGGQVATSILRSISRNKREKASTVSVPIGYRMILKN